MKLVDGDKRDQVPLRGEFQKGEFVSFVRSILNTLELYHELNINPHVAVVVLKSLATEHKTPLEIVGFRKQGNEFILQVKIPGEVEQEEIQKAYDLKYEQHLNLFIKEPSQFNQLFLVKKDTKEAKLLEKLEEGKKQGNVINNINYIITQEGSFGVGVNPGDITSDSITGTSNDVYLASISAKDIVGTTNDAQDIMQMIESLRQQIKALDNQAVYSEALEHLDDVETEIQSSPPKQSRLKASLMILWDLVKDIALVANAVTALAARLDVQLSPLP